MLRFRVLLALARAAFGSFASALFSCSSLARRKAVDYDDVSIHTVPKQIRDLPRQTLRRVGLVLRFSPAPPSQRERYQLTREYPSCHFESGKC